MADEDPANMEVDKHEDVTPAAIPKMKRKQSSGSSGSGSTMDATTALQDRLAALSAMPQRKGRKKKSFDTVENISRSQSVRDRERYYSLADTKKDLNKIVTQRQQKRKATLQARNEEMKKYIKSKRNVLEDDDAKDTQVNADDPALVIKDRQLVKVDDDGDADLATTPLSPPPRKEENSERVMEIDEEKSKTLTSDSQNVVPSSTTASSSETSQTTQTDSTDVNGDEANAKSQSQSQPAKIDPRKSSSSKPVKTPVANPSVNIPMLSQAGSGGGGTSQSNSKRGTGLFRNLFKKKDKEETAAATSSSSSSSSYSSSSANVSSRISSSNSSSNAAINASSFSSSYSSSSSASASASSSSSCSTSSISWSVTFSTDSILSSSPVVGTSVSSVGVASVMR
mmetsp:Transcript_27730/g.45725  ORF Transcript_27730/g.45725 Transcript_27730/m.45725 type:complete len:397 (+) Transcript_27730:50-1240(+)